MTQLYSQYILYKEEIVEVVEEDLDAEMEEGDDVTNEEHH